MSDIDTAVIRGNVANDPTPRVTGSGKEVISFRVATNYGFGESKRTTYHNVTAWGDIAKEAHAKLSKGSRVQIEAHHESGSYDSKKHPGEKVYTYDLIAERVIYLDIDDPDLPTSF